MNLYVTAHCGAAYNTPAAVGDGEPRCRGGEWRFWCAGHGAGGVWSAYGLWVTASGRLLRKALFPGRYSAVSHAKSVLSTKGVRKGLIKTVDL